jgi:uroporphyrinogen-III decarboxylase
MLLKTVFSLSATLIAPLPVVSSSTTSDPLLLRAARGEEVERTPVWMMRQAGRHMKAYRDLVEKYPTFRERSELPEVALEISLQPFRACELHYYVEQHAKQPIE